jgi:hypothetical protein
MSIKKKRRDFRSGAVSGQNRSSGFVPFTPYSDLGVLNFEEILSENHSFRNGRWSGGGPMWLTRDVTRFQPCSIKRFNGAGALLTDGTVRIVGPTIGIPALTPPDHPNDAQLMADGVKAIGLTAPTNPAFNLAYELGELRLGGVPSLPGKAMRETTRRAKGAGGEYLNIEFGWRPMVDSLQDFCRVVEQSDDILRKYQENSDKPIPRSYEFPIVEDSRADNCSFSMQPAVGFFQGGGQTQTYFVKKWFEAEFVYHVPAGGSMTDKMRRYGSYARKLLGVDPSPELVWNISPWSWAVDWFTNIGDVMHNISVLGKDGLVMRHAYMMCHTQKKIIKSGTAFGASTYSEQIVERKTRLGASPYGFGVSYNGLSARQMAVIAALGLQAW